MNTKRKYQICSCCVMDKSDNDIVFDENGICQKCIGKNIHLIKEFGWLLKLFGLFTGLVNRTFGNLSYDMSASDYKTNYRKYNLVERVEETEVR